MWPTPGMSGLQVREGGVNRASKIWRVWEKGSIERHHQSVIINSGAEGAEIFFDH